MNRVAELEAKGAEATALDINVYKELITSPEMKPVWQAFERHSPANFESIADQFLVEIESTFSLWSIAAKQTKGDVVKKYTRLADQAEQLADELSKLPISGLIVSLTSNMTQHFAAGELPEDYASLHLPGNLGGVADYMAMQEDAEPNLILMLRKMAGDLREQADVYRPILKKVQDKNAKRTMFVRRLGRFMRTHFDKPLPQHLATVVWVIFGEVMDERHIRRLLEID